MTHETGFLAASPVSSHGAVTRHYLETCLPALVRDADRAGRRCSIRGDSQERGLVRRRGAAGCERGRM